MKKLLKISCGLGLLLASAACTVVTPPPVYHRMPYPTPGQIQTNNQQVQQVQDAPIVTNVAPPPVYEEVITVAPAPGYIWIGGAWFWEGGRHIWHPGYWSAPRVGFYWVPHRWEHVGVSWNFRVGHWGRH